MTRSEEAFSSASRFFLPDRQLIALVLTDFHQIEEQGVCDFQNAFGVGKHTSNIINSIETEKRHITQSYPTQKAKSRLAKKTKKVVRHRMFEPTFR